MTLRTDIVTALRSVPALAGTGASSRVFEGTFLQPDGTLPAWPAARFTGDNTAFESMCGDSDPAEDDVALQVDLVVGTTPADLEALRLLVIAAMQAMAGYTVTRGIDQYVYDAETKTHRRIIQFTIHL